MNTPNPIVVYRFFKEFRDDKKGGYEEIHMCEYGPFGSDKIRNIERVSRLRKVVDAPPETNPAAHLAKIRWEIIRPRYEAWLAGQEMPEEGTPLAAWNGVSTEQADVLKTKGFKTVEAVAAMTDLHMQNVPIPGVRGIVANAKRFLASADSARVAAELAARDEEAERLRAELADTKALQDEMAQQLAELLAEKRQRVVEEGRSHDEPAKRRGRPRAEDRAAA